MNYHDLHRPLATTLRLPIAFKPQSPLPRCRTMIILAISDLHGRHVALERILADGGPCDVIALAGDLTHFGSPPDVDRIAGLCRQHAGQVLAVAGNCDSEAIARRLEELGIGITGKGQIWEGVGFQGLSGIPPWRPGMYQFPEAELRETLESGYRALNGVQSHVLITHCPPRGSRADRIFLGCHVGSHAVREFIDKTRPTLVICGHVHEARGVEADETTVIVNCGHGASGHYARITLSDANSGAGKHVQVELRHAPRK